jgi:peptidoglycan/xylan/chitin deacetylase (PgdA/CDA1 family)
MGNTYAGKSQISILTYHALDDSGSIVSTSPGVFQAQMRYLSEAGFNVVSFGEVVAHLNEGRPLPARTVAISFDDGYKSVYTEAFPVLRQYGFTATVFLIADYCGKYNDWPGNLPSLKRLPLLSWSEIKEMQKYGIEFGAHTMTHPDLTRLAEWRVDYEMRQSKCTIQDHLGEEVVVFAYPYGKYNRSVKETARKHFRGACSTQLGRIDGRSDVYLLNRVDVYYLSRPGLFRRLPRNDLAAYLKIRQALRNLKQYF